MVVRATATSRRISSWNLTSISGVFPEPLLTFTACTFWIWSVSDTTERTFTSVFLTTSCMSAVNDAFVNPCSLIEDSTVTSLNGAKVGCDVGRRVGIGVGSSEGLGDGSAVGTRVGARDGLGIGSGVGEELGTRDGKRDGVLVGNLDGEADGPSVGPGVGSDVGNVPT